ncbi:MAG: cellulase family glycosylhydrolase [Treponema sp.]|jgi:hypothetical protein|nr:cellulase family glycosylhydrolase [Treponema sp.]
MRIAGKYITDDRGRILILRGCNLGGNSKYPFTPSGETQNPASLDLSGGVSFVGRPFPLEEAERHFRRLSGWGFTCLRFNITWEAVEHEGPGIYDEAYLAYLRKLLKMAEQWDISVFIDPHQDVWSRWTGGDGAPAWTLEKLGMDLDRLDETGAALTQQRYTDKVFPRMIWPTNYNRYGAATMFTLFFGGNSYAPDCTVEGRPVQDWLQDHYLKAMRHCYRRLKSCRAIIGWGTMNEPHPGFIGYRNLEGLENFPVVNGAIPSPLQAMAAASGHTMSIPVYPIGLNADRTAGREVINPHGVSLFREGFSCPWKQAGVWTDEGWSPRIVRRDHFSRYDGRPADFVEDFLKPFNRRFIETMREVNERALIFIEGIPHGKNPNWTKEDPPNVINAFHWYDGPTLYLKFFLPWFSISTITQKPVLGRKGVEDLFSGYLEQGTVWTQKYMGDIPCFLGEFGLPFDMNGRRAYKTGDYRLHEEAMDIYYDGIDKNLLHSTIWHYCASNTREYGDGWNGEDLSIVFQGEGRAAGGWLRPYPMASAGVPLRVQWDRKAGIFSFRFRADPAVEGPTEIFAPPECFGGNPKLTIDPPGVLQAEYRREERRIFIVNEGYTGEAVLRAEADR